METGPLSIMGNTSITGVGTLLLLSGGGSGDINQGGQVQFTNSNGGVPTPSRYIRIDSSGTFQIISDGYTAAILDLTNAGVLTTASDKKLKRNIDYKFKYGIEEIKQLKPVYYTAKGDKSKTKILGFIAQDVVEVIPEIISGEEGSYKMGYDRLSVILVKAVQEQQIMIEKLEKRITELEKK